MVIIPIILAFFLRIYKIGSNYFFAGENGKELLYVRNFVQNGGLPLVGLPTSHEWLTYGPVYYWILIPLVKIFGNSPYILFWISLVVSIIGIVITYFVFTKIIDKKFSLILTFFISVSPLWIWVTRLSKLHTFFFILTPVLIYFLYKIWNKERRYIFWLGFVFGLLFSFHYSQIPIFLVIFAAFWIKRKYLIIRDYLIFFLGLVIPNITVLIYDAGNKFSMIKNLVAWIPYRIAGFSGIYPKNNLDSATAVNTLSSFNEFLGRNIFWDGRFWILTSVLFILMFVVFVLQNRKVFKKDFFVFYLTSSTIVQFLALFILTSPPLHYFFPVFLNFWLLFSYFIYKYWQNKFTRILTALFIILMSVINVIGLNSEHANDMDYIPLKTQELVAASIVKDANGAAFSLKRIGPFDYFPENYDQNYRFLILSKGGNLVDTATNVYTIVEDLSKGRVSVKKND